MGTNARQKISYGPRGRGQIAILPVKYKNQPDKWTDVKVTITDKDNVKTVYHLDPEEQPRQFGNWNLTSITDVFIELDIINSLL